MLPIERNELFATGSDFRRSFMKKGALASSALVIGTSGTAAAQDDDDAGVEVLDDNWKALTFVDNFHPNSRFAFVSGVIQWNPNYGDVTDSFFSDYNTHQIRWLNTDNVVPLFVAQDANIGEYDEDLGFIPDPDDPNQPQIFEMNREWTPFGDNERLITVNATPVSEDVEDVILDADDWWQDTGNDETATDNGS